MAIKQNEQPTYVKGSKQESAANTLTVLEIQVPRILGSRMLFDIDEIFIDVDIPRATLGANGYATVDAQVIVSELEPTSLLSYADDRLLAYKQSFAYCNATDHLYAGTRKGASLWTTQSHANYIPDDKIWLIVMGSSNATAKGASCRVKGSLAKVSIEDFEALVLSRLGQ